MYYYKRKDGKAYLKLSTPEYDNNDNYERITEQEFNSNNSQNN